MVALGPEGKAFKSSFSYTCPFFNVITTYYLILTLKL